MNRTKSIAIAVALAAGSAFAGLTALPAGADDGGTTSGKGGVHRGHGAATGSLADPGTFFAGSLNGANEVPVADGPGGDKDGHAIALMRVQDDAVTFAVQFRGIAAPTAGELHQGAKGVSGPVRIPFFTRRLPDGQTSVTGTVQVKDQQLLDDLRTDPGGFYFDLRNGEFPGGAVRGQVHGLTSSLDMDHALQQNFQASVIQGAQIYACTEQADGTFAFTQDNVRATLDTGISHFFARPGPAGPPEWLSRDRSAVTGRLISRLPNGPGNIAELDLAATQAGRPFGQLAGVDEILRLNTVGGLAPAGVCDPATQPTATVSYHADYLFLDGAGPVVPAGAER